MMTIGNERCAADPPPDTNAKNCTGFVAEKTYARCDGDRPQMRNILRVKKSVDAFVASDNCAEKDGQNNDDTSKVLDAPVAKSKSFVGPLACKKKSNS